jgi:hypothetical protein
LDDLLELFAVAGDLVAFAFGELFEDLFGEGLAVEQRGSLEAQGRQLEEKAAALRLLLDVGRHLRAQLIELFVEALAFLSVLFAVVGRGDALAQLLYEIVHIGGELAA